MAWRDLLQRSCAVCLLAWMYIVIPPLRAQPAQTDTKFDVASIKPSPAGGSRGPGRWELGALPGGRFLARSQTVRSLIVMAYNLHDFQILGGPGWINSERYDIEAQATGNPPRQQITGPMLQALLKDRFQLQLHHETKDLPVFTLVAAKGGVRLKPSKLEGSCAVLYQKEACAEIRKGPFSLDVKAVSMEDFIEVLSFTVGRVLIDQTGFHGLFDAHLEFTPDETAFAGLGGSPGHDAMSGGGSRGGRAEGVAPYRPSISLALEEQLGLRLESKKGPVEVLVVDHVDRPSAN